MAAGRRGPARQARPGVGHASGGRGRNRWGTLAAMGVPGRRGRHDDRLHVLSGALRAFAEATTDYERLLEVVARTVSDVVADGCIVRVLSDGGWLTPVAVHLPLEAYVADAHAAAEARTFMTSPRNLAEYAWGQRLIETGEPFILPVLDIAQFRAAVAPEVAKVYETIGIHSMLVVVLRLRGESIGTLTMFRFDPASPAFDDDDRDMAQALADHAALAIEIARSYAAEREARAAAVSANRTAHEPEEAHRLLFDASPVPLFMFDVESLQALAVNEAALILYGYTHEEFIRLRVSDLAVDGQDSTRARLAAWGDTEAAGTSHYRRKDGSKFVAEYMTRALVFGDRRARIAVVKDITERYEAEQTRALLAAIVQSSNDAIISKRLDGTITSWNPAAERLFGYMAEEALGKPIALVVPLDRCDEERSIIDRVSAGEQIKQYATVRLRKDGSMVEVAISVSPILDAARNVVGASKTARDLTAQRRSDEALRLTEEQLRQSQKMEAVGRLAGGVAHDFNNVLSVILSYGEMLLADLKPGDPVRADIEEIHKAGKRATDLTRQLLMFSRQQVLAPKVLDLNDLLTSMDKMLQRILGADVDLVSLPTLRLGRVRADPSNIEQVIMNLVVNARDAMPTGGKLTMETANVILDDAYAQAHLGVSPGPHVMLAVTDTGTGIEKATLARIFEPFFTTKESGKGTGLGLSTVFGVVRQSGGSVWVYSEVGKGTTFKVYLPRVDAAVETVGETLPPTTLRGSEAILLVEDDDQVRIVARGILRRAGYHVIDARNAGEALLHSEKHPTTIHLLLSDVVMPQVSGPELAKRLASARPDMKVLCMSGYTDDSIVRHGVLEAHIAYLQKPITPDALTTRVREVLDGLSN
jgi:two-component system cell cycle sensor histidine kinase/response regulator CckA